MTLRYNERAGNYTYDIQKSEYTYLLINNSITINIDSKKFNCDTCDSIFEQVFDFVYKNYKEDKKDNRYAVGEIDRKIDLNELDEEEKHTDTSFLTGLNEKAKDALKTQMNEKMANVENSVLPKNILTGLNEKATDVLKNKMNEKMAHEETKHADTSFLTALQEKAKDALNKHLEPEKKK